MSEQIESLNLDAVVLPYQAVPPPPWDPAKDKYTAGERSNNLTSGTGLPGVIMPGGYTPDNLPIAIQFVGRPWGDLKLLQAAYGYEQTSRRRKPPAATPALPGEVFEYQPARTAKAASSVTADLSSRRAR